MAGAYPSKRELQWEFWHRRVMHSRSRYVQDFKACQKLIDLYDMVPANERERRARAQDMDDPQMAVKTGIVFGWIDQHMANTAAHSPTFRCRPTNSDGMGSERSVARINNYFYRELDFLHQDKRALLDSLLCPWGVEKLGYTADVEGDIFNLLEGSPEYVFDDPVEEFVYLVAGVATAILPTQDHQMFIEHHVAALQQPGAIPEANVSVVEANIRERKRLLNEGQPSRHAYIRKESVFKQRWQPDEFVPDCLSTDGLAECQFVAFGWEEPIDEVLSNPLYENLKDLEPSHRMMDAPSRDGKFATDDFGMVRGYEIWVRNFPVSLGRRRNLLLTIADGHKKFLRYEEEWPYQNIEDFPCELLHHNTSVKQWWNKPPLLLAGADSTQMLMNEMLDSTLSAIRKEKNLFLYDPQHFSEDEIEEVIGAPDMTCYPVEGLAEVGERAIVPVAFNSTIQNRNQLVSIIQNLFDRAAGTPQPIAMGKTDTATEFAGMDRKNTAREDERAENFSQFQVRGQRKIWQLLTQYRPREMFLVDPYAADEVERFSNITEEMARGEFAFEMDVTSAGLNLSIERKNWGDLFNLMAGAAAQFQELYGQAPRIDLLMERLLIMGYDFQNPEEIMPWLQQLGPEGAGQLLNTQQGETSPLREATNQGRQEGPLLREQAVAPAPSAGRTAGSAVRPDRDRKGM